MRHFAGSAAAVALLAVAPAARTQQVAPAARAELVQLDVVVTDPHGAPVRDLSGDDFEVFEDGKPQRVAQFYVAGRASALSVAHPDESGIGVVVEPAPPSRPPSRQVVIVVDDLHIGLPELSVAKQALRRLVDEVVGEEDNLAMVTTGSHGVLQQFTRDHSLLKQAIERLTAQERTVERARGSQMSPEQAALVLRGDRAALQLATETVITEPGSVVNSDNPQVQVEARGSSGSAAGASAMIQDAVERVAQKEVQRQASAILNEALRFSAVTLATIEDVVRGLAGLPGRKLCLVVSDGFLDGGGSRDTRSVDLRRVLDAATRSGTVVYTLDSRALATGADASAAGLAVTPGLQSRVDREVHQLLRDTLDTLAGGTGGFMVRNTNDLATGLRRMLEDNETYYLLAYEPANTRRDGRFRRINVHLPRRPELTVRTRRGYFATDERKAAPSATAPLLAAAGGAAAPLPAAEARAALSAPIAPGGIPVALSADYVDLPPAGPQVVVRARVDLARLRWEEVEGRHHVDVELLGGVFDARGQPVGAPFGRRADLDLAPPDFERARAAGIDYQQLVPLRPGRYEVRLLTRERRLAQQGGATQSVDVPDLAERKLTLSGLFLGRDAPTAGAAPVSASRLFKRGDSVSFQFYVYNATLDERGKGDVVLQAQVWSAGKAVAASRLQPARLQMRDGVAVPETNVMSLEGMAPGAYELRVFVQDRKTNASTVRRVDFNID